jgi:hypothetical protein
MRIPDAALPIAVWHVRDLHFQVERHTPAARDHHKTGPSSSEKVRAAVAGLRSGPAPPQARTQDDKRQERKHHKPTDQCAQRQKPKTAANAGRPGIHAKQGSWKHVHERRKHAPRREKQPNCIDSGGGQQKTHPEKKDGADDTPRSADHCRFYATEHVGTSRPGRRAQRPRNRICVRLTELLGRKCALKTPD